MSVPQTIRIPGPPHGKARPRFVRATGRTYTDAATVAAEERVLQAWRDAGEPRWHDAPLSVSLIGYYARPGSHFLGNGEYSKAGREASFCLKKPDLDNVVKLQLDALNDHAFDDDCQVVELSLRKFWAPKRASWSLLTIGVAAPPLLVEPVGVSDPTPWLG